jgi:hypothetical protein
MKLPDKLPIAVHLGSTHVFTTAASCGGGKWEVWQWVWLGGGRGGFDSQQVKRESMFLSFPFLSSLFFSFIPHISFSHIFHMLMLSCFHIVIFSKHILHRQWRFLQDHVS